MDTSTALKTLRPIRSKLAQISKSMVSIDKSARRSQLKLTRKALEDRTRQWDQLAAMSQQFPDLPSPVRRNGVYLKTALVDMLNKIDGSSIQVAASSVPKLAELACFVIGDCMENWTELDEQEAVYNAIPDHLKRPVLLQHLARLLLSNVDLPHILSECVEVLMKFHAYQQAFDIMKRLIELEPSNEDCLVRLYQYSLTIRKATLMVKHAIHAQTRRTILKPSVFHLCLHILEPEHRLRAFELLFQKLLMLRTSLVSSAKTRQPFKDLLHLILTEYIITTLHAKPSEDTIQNLKFLYHSPLFAELVPCKVAIAFLFVDLHINYGVEVAGFIDYAAENINHVYKKTHAGVLLRQVFDQEHLELIVEALQPETVPQIASEEQSIFPGDLLDDIVLSGGISGPEYEEINSGFVSEYSK